MKKAKRLIIPILLALIVIFAGYRFLSPSEARYVYQTQPVTRGAITATISATGKVNAVEMVDVGTQVSGTIQEIYVDYNSIVKKGQLLALLDPDVLQSKVDESKASLALAQAGVTRARADVTEAQRNDARNKELWNRKLIAKSEMEYTETQLLVAKASQAEAAAKVAQAQETLKQAQTNLSYARILSPINGVVVDRQVDVGQTVAASLQTPTLFSIAKDLTQMQVEADIDEADIGRIAEGQRAVCTFDAFPQDKFKATVKQKRLNAETISNVVTYTVILTVDNAEQKLMPGMTANVSVITEQRDDILKIPAAALRFSPPADAVASTPEKAENGARTGLIAMPPRRSESGAQSTGQNVWIVESGQIVGSLAIDPLSDIGVSDRTWVELKGDATNLLREGQELAVAFSKEASGTAVAGTKR